MTWAGLDHRLASRPSKQNEEMGMNSRNGGVGIVGVIVIVVIILWLVGVIHI
jgi:hypothetical protein